MESQSPYIVSINISNGGIPKLPVDALRITFAGLEGDGHNHTKHYDLIQAVCLQDAEKLEELSGEGYALVPGSTGENLTVRNLQVNTLPLGTTLQFPGGVVLEISKVRKPCYVMDAIDAQLKSDVLGRHGMYAKVIREGFIKKGDLIQIALSNVVNKRYDQ